MASHGPAHAIMSQAQVVESGAHAQSSESHTSARHGSHCMDLPCTHVVTPRCCPWLCLVWAASWWVRHTTSQQSPLRIPHRFGGGHVTIGHLCRHSCGGELSHMFCFCADVGVACSDRQPTRVHKSRGRRPMLVLRLGPAWRRPAGRGKATRGCERGNQLTNPR